MSVDPNADVWAQIDAMKALAPPVDLDRPDGIGDDAWRTEKNRRLLAAGIHPATRRPLLAVTDDGPLCCGFCRFSDSYGHHNRTYWKCEKHRLGVSHSSASDIRRSWPACDLYESETAHDGGHTPDLVDATNGDGEVEEP